MSLESFEDEEKEGVNCFPIWVYLHNMQEEKRCEESKSTPLVHCRKMKKMENATMGSNLDLSQIVGPNGPKTLRA